MNYEKPGENILAKNRESLGALSTAIILSQKKFSLILVSCSYRSLREQILKDLDGLLKPQRIINISEIRKLEIPKSAKTLYDTIKVEIREQQPSALMVFGLESVNTLDELLSSANGMRNQFKENFSFPLVLFVNDKVLYQLDRLAPDFRNWTTLPKKFDLPTDQLIELLCQFSQNVFLKLQGDDEEFETNSSILGSNYRAEFNSAQENLKNRNIKLEPEMEASIKFLSGRDFYAEHQIDNAIKCYKESLKFWQKHDIWQGVLRFHLGLCYQHQDKLNKKVVKEQLTKAGCEFELCIKLFQQAKNQKLVDKSIEYLCEILRRLENWDYLQEKAKQLEGIYTNDPVKLAQAKGFLAEVALNKSKLGEGKKELKNAEKLAQKALDLLSENKDVSEYNQKLQGWYLFLLAQAQRDLNSIENAVISLEKAAEIDHRQNPKLHIDILTELQTLYFKQRQYLEAFSTKVKLLSIKQQYGLSPFLGPFRLKPKQQCIEADLDFVSLGSEKIIDQRLEVAPEIENSGRLQNVNELIEKLDKTEHKLIVIHGSSGVGKSSLLEAGLLPKLLKTVFLDNCQLMQPIVMRDYHDWEKQLGEDLLEVIQKLDNESIENELNSYERIINTLINVTKNKIVTIIFDQLEELFWLYQKDNNKVNIFFKFIKECVNNSSINVKIILSLRDDLLAKLEQIISQENENNSGNQNNEIDTDVIRDILRKESRYPLNNLSKKNAKCLIENIAKNQFTPKLIEQIVEDLADNFGKVSPIELQIVGAQLQTDEIDTIEKYRHLGEADKKEKLIEKFLEEIIQDCGFENQRVARLVLTSLIDEQQNRSLKKKYNDLRKDLGKEYDEKKLNLVLEILVKSGFVLKSLENSQAQYRLAHDYLVSFISKHCKPKLFEGIQEELGKTIKQLTQAARRSKAIMLVALFVITILVVIGFDNSLQIYQREKIVDKSNESLRKFKEGKQLEGLKLAVKTGAELKKKIEKDEHIIAEYPEVMFALDKIVENIEEKNQINNKTAINSISFSSDNNLIVIARDDSTVQIWNLQQNKIYPLNGHQSDVKSVSFITNVSHENLIATASGDNTVKVWQQKGEQFKEIKTFSVHQGWVNSVSFSPDGKLIAAGANRQVWLFNLLSQDDTQSKKYNYQTLVKSVTFSPKENLLATALGDGTVELQQVSEQGIQHKTLQWNTHQNGIESLSFSPDGKSLATAGKNGEVILWDLSGKQLFSLQANSDGRAVKDLCFSFNKDLLAIADSNSTAQIWDISTRKKIKEFKGHQGIVTSVRFSLDGKFIATSDSGGEVRLWQRSPQPMILFDSYQKTVASISFIPNKQRFATLGEEGSVKIWDTTGQEVIKLPAPSIIKSVGFSPDGHYIATIDKDGAVQLWDYSSEQPKLMPLKDDEKQIRSVSFSPDNTLLVTAYKNGLFQFWNLSDLKPKLQRVHPGGATNLIFSPKGKFIATIPVEDDDNNSALLWNLLGNQINLWHQDEKVYKVAFSSDEQRIATIGKAGKIRIWDLLRQKKDSKPDELPYLGEITSLYFSPNGMQIITLGKDGAASILKLSGNDPPTIFSRNVSSLLISPDGQRIATAEANATVKLWNLKGKLLAEFPSNFRQIRAISFSSDGKVIVAAGDKGMVQEWHVENLDKLLQRGCQWLDYYRETNLDIDKSDPQTCDEVLEKPSR